MEFTPETARQAWDEGAEAWEEFVESGADYYRTEVHGPALLDACEPGSGSRVLDLGCGQGWFTRQLARRGAQMTGIDLAERQLANAQRHEDEDPLGIGYLLLDAGQAAEHLPAGSFDMVTACMSVQDMPDPGRAIRSAAALLRPGGRLVFSVPHPATETADREWERDAEGRKLALKVDRYFDSGVGTLRWDMPRLRYAWETPRWRHTLEEWAGLVTGAGLLISGIREPRPTTEQGRSRPDLDDCARMPYFLVLACVKHL
jgi:2-polyprenyl-3-methyl-5-hydroxy-6-metoxy-1,4-benzoquinol methylase